MKFSSEINDQIRSVGLGQTRLERCKSVVISERSDGSWRAEEEGQEDGVIIYLAIKYHPVVKYALGLLTTQGYGEGFFITWGKLS